MCWPGVWCGDRVVWGWVGLGCDGVVWAGMGVCWPRV